MTRKYLGNRASIEAYSPDGQRWQLKVFEHGRLTKHTNIETSALEKLATDRGMTQEAVTR